jgi:nitronate monooxygenase
MGAGLLTPGGTQARLRAMPPSLTTPLCEQLGISHPVVQAPMAGGWTTPELVAAVTAAGGLGSLAAGRMTVEGLEDAITRVRAETSKPFCVNFLVAPPEHAPSDVESVQAVLDEVRAGLDLPPGPRELRLGPSPVEDQLERTLDAGVEVVGFAMGCPELLIARARSAGATVMVMVTSRDEAVEAESAGADVVVAQGIEAGGHRGTFRVAADAELPQVGTLALVPQVLDAVSIPVIAAGGIMDGRGLAAVLSLGAGAAQLGTRFLLTKESGAYAQYRSWIATRDPMSTCVTRWMTGRPARGFRNRLLEKLEASGLEPLPWPYQALAAEDIYRASVERGLTDTIVMLAGQGPRRDVRELRAAELVAELVREAAAVLDALRRPPEG